MGSGIKQVIALWVIQQRSSMSRRFGVMSIGVGLKGRNLIKVTNGMSMGIRFGVRDVGFQRSFWSRGRVEVSARFLFYTSFTTFQHNVGFIG